MSRESFRSSLSKLSIQKKNIGLVSLFGDLELMAVFSKMSSSRRSGGMMTLAVGAGAAGMMSGFVAPGSKTKHWRIDSIDFCIFLLSVCFSLQCFFLHAKKVPLDSCALPALPALWGLQCLLLQPHLQALLR